VSKIRETQPSRTSPQENFSDNSLVMSASKVSGTGQPTAEPDPP
jgi:hypothetical protein